MWFVAQNTCNNKVVSIQPDLRSDPLNNTNKRLLPDYTDTNSP